MTHISYECAKKLKDFLKESAPEPMDGEHYWIYDDGEDTGPLHKQDVCTKYGKMPKQEAPAYQLHDLLSKPFCEVLSKRYRYRGSTRIETWAEIIMHSFAKSYFYGGLSAVESSLIKLIQGEIE